MIRLLPMWCAGELYRRSPRALGRLLFQEEDPSIAGSNIERLNDGIFHEKLQRGKSEIMACALPADNSSNVNNERGEEQRIRVLTVGIPIGRQRRSLLM